MPNGWTPVDESGWTPVDEKPHALTEADYTNPNVNPAPGKAVWMENQQGAGRWIGGASVQQARSQGWSEPKTQFEKDRTPQGGTDSRFISNVASAAGNTLKGVAMLPVGLAKTAYHLPRNAAALVAPSMVNPAEETAQQAASMYVNDLNRQAAGYSIPYRIASGIAESTGIANPTAMENAAAHGDDEAVYGQALGSTLGAAATPYVTKGALSAIKVAPKIAPVAQRAGVGIMNQTIGALANDFKRGANPGQAYLEGGGGPALNMQGLADKGNAILDKAGEQLGNVYQNATENGVRIPVPKVTNAINAPINELKSIQSGPGGVGVNPELQKYQDSFDQSIPVGPDISMSPNDVFAIKRGIQKNAKWTEPTKLDLNAVRQEGVGGLGGILTEAVPEAGPLNKIYQGANNFSRRADLRAKTGSAPLAQLARRGAEAGLGGVLGYATHNPLLAAAPIVLDSVPVRTAAATALYQGGKLLANPKIGKINPRPIMVPSLSEDDIKNLALQKQ